MRRTLLCLSSLVLCVSVGAGQTRNPVPPGVREADKLPAPADVPPLIGPQRKAVEAAQLKREAAELALLAQSLPAEVDQVAGGRLPKDLNDRLRQIEKLAKRLRSELSR